MNSGTTGYKTYGERLHIALLKYEAELAKQKGKTA